MHGKFCARAFAIHISTTSWPFDTSILELFLMKLLQLDLSSPTYLKITIDCQRVSLLGAFFGHLPLIETISANVQTLSN